MAKKPKNTFKPGNTLAVGHSEGKTGAPTKAAKAALRAILEEKFEFEDKGEKKLTSIHDTAILTLYAALKARDKIGNPTTEAIRAVELVLAYSHGPPKKDEGSERPPMQLVVNCTPIVNNQVNVGGRHNA